MEKAVSNNSSFSVSGISVPRQVPNNSFKAPNRQNNQLKEQLAQLDQLKSKMEGLKNTIQKKTTSDKVKGPFSKIETNQTNNGSQKVVTAPSTCSNGVEGQGYSSLVKKVNDSIRRSYQLANKPLTQQRDLNTTSEIIPHSYKKVASERSLNENFNNSAGEHTKLLKVLNAFKELRVESKEFSETQDGSTQCLNSEAGTALSWVAAVSATKLAQLASYCPEDATPEGRCWASHGFVYGKELGRGKFGHVYLAKHIETGFIVAIKRVLKETIKRYNMVDRFVEEIKLHSRLNHPNIVKFYGFFEEEDSICLVLEYLSGGTLFDYLNELGCLPLKDALSFLREIIGALDYLHQQSIIHRDLKPENIVISSAGVAKICDFGWSAVVQTYRTTFCGTLDYASPEIIERKEYNQSVDVWCVGVLTYELLIGRAPFQNTDRDSVMRDIINVGSSSLPYMSCLSPEVTEFVEAILQKDPTQRPKIYELLDFPLFKTDPLFSLEWRGRKVRKNTMG